MMNILDAREKIYYVICGALFVAGRGIGTKRSRRCTGRIPRQNFGTRLTFKIYRFFSGLLFLLIIEPIQLRPAITTYLTPAMQIRLDSVALLMGSIREESTGTLVFKLFCRIGTFEVIGLRSKRCASRRRAIAFGGLKTALQHHCGPISVVGVYKTTYVIDLESAFKPAR